jgi:hypothetical protein
MPRVSLELLANTGGMESIRGAPFQKINADAGGEMIRPVARTAFGGRS